MPSNWRGIFLYSYPPRCGLTGEELHLAEDEIAFYDALEVNDRVVKALGDETLKGIARTVVETVCNRVTIDRTVWEAVRAKTCLRSLQQPEELHQMDRIEERHRATESKRLLENRLRFGMIGLAQCRAPLQELLASVG